MRENTHLKLSNLGAAARVDYKETVSADLRHLAYAAPELARMYLDLDDRVASDEQYYGYINPVKAANKADDRYRTENETHRGDYNFSSSCRCPLEDGEPSSFFTAGAAAGAAVGAVAALYDAGAHGNIEDTQLQYPNDLTASAAHGALSNPSTGQRIQAHFSQDMWSVGAVLYLLCTGESLFLTSLDEHIDADQLALLADWPDFVKQRRLAKIADPCARSLVAQLLSKCPQVRPSAEQCLRHPFFLSVNPSSHSDSSESDRGGGEELLAVRFVGAPALHDVYICYRRPSSATTPVRPTFLRQQDEERHARLLQQHLQQQQEMQEKQQQEQQENQEEQHAATPSGATSAGGRKVKDEREAALLRMFGVQALDSTSLASSTDGSGHTDSYTHTGSKTDTFASSDEFLGSEARDHFDASQVEGGAGAVVDGEGRGGSVHTVFRIPHYKDVGEDDTLHCQLLHDYFLQMGIDTVSGGAPASTNSDSDPAALLMTQSSAAVIVFSRYAVSHSAHRLEKLSAEAAFDQFYFELRLALELADMGLLERGIYLVAIGDTVLTDPDAAAATGQEAGTGASAGAGIGTGHGAGAGIGTGHGAGAGKADILHTSDDYEKEGAVYDAYFQTYFGDMVGRYGGSHAYSIPDVVVRSVEERVTNFMVGQGLGFPKHFSRPAIASTTSTNRGGGGEERFEPSAGESIKDVMRRLVRLPTFHIVGPQAAAFSSATTSIAQLVRGAGSLALPATPYSRPSTGAFSMLDRSRLATPIVVSRTPSRATSRVQSRAHSRVGSRAQTPGSPLLLSASFSANPAAAAAMAAAALYTGVGGDHGALGRVVRSSQGTRGSRIASPEVRYYQQQQEQLMGAAVEQYTFYPSRAAGSSDPADIDAHWAALNPDEQHLPLQQSVHPALSQLSNGHTEVARSSRTSFVVASGTSSQQLSSTAAIERVGTTSTSSDVGADGGGDDAAGGGAVAGDDGTGADAGDGGAISGADIRRRSTYRVSRNSSSRGTIHSPSLSSSFSLQQQRLQDQILLLQAGHSRLAEDADSSMRAASSFLPRSWGPSEQRAEGAEVGEASMDAEDEQRTLLASDAGPGMLTARMNSSRGSMLVGSGDAKSGRNSFSRSSMPNILHLAGSPTSQRLSSPQFPQQQIEYYNDEVKLPHLTEIVGVERAKTAETLMFLSEKLEASENTVSNLEQELALVKERMRRKDEEVRQLRHDMRMHVQREEEPQQATLPPILRNSAP